jgi:hypothetical protein
VARLIDGTGAARRATPARANRALSADADAGCAPGREEGGGLIPHRDPPAA